MLHAPLSERLNEKVSPASPASLLLLFLLFMPFLFCSILVSFFFSFFFCFSLPPCFLAFHRFHVFHASLFFVCLLFSSLFSFCFSWLPCSLASPWSSTSLLSPVSLLSLCSSLPLPLTTEVNVCWEVTCSVSIDFPIRSMSPRHNWSECIRSAPKVTPNVKEHSGSCLPQFPARRNQPHTQQCELPKVIQHPRKNICLDTAVRDCCLLLCTSTKFAQTFVHQKNAQHTS